MRRPDPISDSASPDPGQHRGTAPDPSRREFLVGAAGMAGSLAVGGSAPDVLAQDASPDLEKLAIDGGPPTLARPADLGIRWGAPERERLEEMLGQKSLFYWKGPQTTRLIEAVRAIHPFEHVMTCSSGTAALHIAVAAAGVGPGDEVITTPVTDVGTVIGAIYQMGVPVFADLEPTTYNLDPASVERLVTPRTKAIVAVHLAGVPCDMAPLRAIADKHGLVLIEDCAQAWGARHRGAPVGSFGHVACWSLQDSKHVTCGDGGIVASSDPKIGPLLQRFGDKGFDRVKPGPLESFATNYRMSEPQAAVAAAQLGRLEGIASARARLGAILGAGIAETPGVLPHGVRPDDRPVFWFYMFRIVPEAMRVDRATFVKALAAEGAPVSAGYIAVPLYGNPVFREHAFFAGRWPVREMGLTTMDYAKVACPEAEAILATGVRVALHQEMTDADAEGIARAVRKVARACSA